MKNFTYIFLFFVSLAFVSCEKLDLKPSKDNCNSEDSIWRSAGSGFSTIGEGTSGDGAGIIDPNDSGDGSSKTSRGGKVKDGTSIIDPNDDGGGSDKTSKIKN